MLRGAAWCCVVLRGAAWCCVVLLDAACCVLRAACCVLRAACCVILAGDAWYLHICMREWLWVIYLDSMLMKLLLEEDARCMLIPG